MKIERLVNTVIEHYQSYPKLPFGRAKEFDEVKDSLVVIKRHITKVYYRWWFFAWQRETKVSFTVYVTHYFRNGQVGGTAMHNLTKGVLEDHVERCYQHPPRPNWRVVA